MTKKGRHNFFKVICKNNIESQIKFGEMSKKGGHQKFVEMN